MKKRRSLLIMILFTIIVICVSVGSYAFFGARLGDNNVQANITTKNVAINLGGCENLVLKDIVPGDSKSCTFTVRNDSDNYITYDYVFDDVFNELSYSDDLVYHVTKNEEFVKKAIFPTNDFDYISVDNCLAPGEMDTYVVTIFYLEQDFDQSDDMGKTVTANILVNNIVNGNECAVRYHTLTIDPKPGTYKGSSDPVKYIVPIGNEVSIEAALGNEVSTFKHWNSSNGKNYVSSVIVDEDITLAASWDYSEDAVCRIDYAYYPSIEEANRSALDGDVITMIKSTQESPTITKNVTLDLNGFTVTGTLTNTGTLKLIGDGTISSSTNAIVNNGTLTVGDDDLLVSITYPHIEGVDTGIVNNNILNFYDGIIIGEEAIRGVYSRIPDNYYVYVNHDDLNNIQSAWLVNSFDTRAICRINNVIFMNLNDAINFSDLNAIHFIRNAELAYDVNVDSDKNRDIYLDGYVVNSGYQFVNDGDLSIIESSGEAGTWNSSVAITNNNNMLIRNMNINSTTNDATVSNNGNLELVNTKLNAVTGYGLKLTSGIVEMDSNSIINSTNSYGIDALGTSKITGDGTIYGLYIDTTGDITFDGPTLYNNTSRYNIYYVKNGGFIFEDGLIEGMNTSSMVYTNNTSADNIRFTMNGGLFTSTYNVSAINVKFVNLTLNGGQVNLSNASSTFLLGGTNIDMNDISLSAGSFIRTNNNGVKGTIDGGTINCTSTSSSYYCINNYGHDALTINNVDLDAKYGIKIDGSLIINDGTYDTMYNTLYIGSNLSDTTTIYGGNFHSTNNYAFELTNNAKVTLFGGTYISDNTYAVYNHITNNSNGSWFIIGDNDGNVSITEPVFVGKTYGVYSNATYGTFEVYDGVFKGRTGGINGSITNIAEGYNVSETGEEIIDSQTYIVESLVFKQDFLQVGDNTYNDFNEAILEVRSGNDNVIRVIADQQINQVVTFSATDNVVLDLNGYSLGINNQFVINGKLNIIDNSIDESGTISANKSQALYLNNSNALLTIDGGNYISNYSTSTAISGIIFVNYGNFIINNGNFSNEYSLTSSSPFIYINGTGKGENIINDGNFNITKTNGYVVDVHSSTLVINGGEFVDHVNTSSNVRLFNASRDITFNDGIYVKDNGSFVYLSNANAYITNANIACGNTGNNGCVNGSTLYMSGGSITTNTGNSVSGDFNISGGTITSNNGYGLYGKGTVSNGLVQSLSSYAIYVYGSSGVIQLIVGTKNDDITGGPTIIGKTYGVYTNTRDVSLYDGVIMGETGSVNPLSYVSMCEDGSSIYSDTETVEGTLYHRSYLVDNDNFLESNDILYNSLQKAINDCSTDGICVINLTSSASIGEVITIPNNKNIVLNLNGYTLSESATITNNGTFKIHDDLDGTFTYSGYFNIINNKNLEFDNINVNFNLYDDGIYNNNAAAVLNINDSNVNLLNSSFTSNKLFSINYGSFNITNSTVSLGANLSTVFSTANSTNTTIRDCDIAFMNLNSTGDLFSVAGNILIDGGTYYGGMTLNGYYAKAEILDGTFNLLGNDFYVSTSKQDNVISGGTFTSTNNTTLLDVYNANLTITDGAIVNNGNGYGIRNRGTLVMTGGSVVSNNNYGVYSDGGSSNSLTLGIDDGSVNINTPSIQGSTYGVYTNNAKLNFYDGVLKGRTKGYNVVNTIPNNTNLTLEIEEGFEKVYLVSAVPFISNNGTMYSNLQTAIDEASDGDILVLTNNGETYYNVVNAKEIVIDLSGFTLACNLPIVNNGSLSIYDSRDQGKLSYTIDSSSSPFITNNNELFINNANIDAYYAIYNNSSETLRIFQSEITANDYAINSRYSNINIDNSTISGGNNVINISNDFTSQITVDNSTINSSGRYAFNTGRAELLITSTDIFGVIDSSASTLTVSYSTINGQNLNYNVQALINYSGTGHLYVNNVDIYSSDRNSLSNGIKNGGYMIGDNINIYYNDISIYDDSSGIINNGEMHLDKVGIYGNNMNDGVYGITDNSNGTNTIRQLTIDITSNETSKPIYGYYHNGLGSISIDELNISIDAKNSSAYGIYNNSEGVFYLLNSLIDVNAKNNSYGVYNMLGEITFIGGSILATSNDNYAYGVYNNDIGSFIMGEFDGVYHNDKPNILAISTNGTGIGVRKVNGFFKYYDGIITGSTSAKPETTSLVETGYEVKFYNDTNNYEYCILEPMVD